MLPNPNNITPTRYKLEYIVDVNNLSAITIASYAVVKQSINVNLKLVYFAELELQTKHGNVSDIHAIV